MRGATGIILVGDNALDLTSYSSMPPDFKSTRPR